jgi:hypothetical protein
MQKVEPYKAIIKTVEEKTGLVVVRNNRRNGREGVLTGSVAERIYCYAPCRCLLCL